MSATPTRIYTVSNKKTGLQRMVDATSQSAALSHVARDEFTVEVTDPKTAASLVGMGVMVETAGVYQGKVAFDHTVGASDDVTQQGASA